MPPISPANGDQPIAMLPMVMIQESLNVIPQFLESVRAEQADCLVYDSMIALDRETVTAERLREAVAEIARNPSFRTHAQAIHESDSYQRATDG